jgi:hypothetical protein
MHPPDGVLKRHLHGVEEILDGYRGVRLADHFLPDRHLRELPDQLEDKRRQPPSRFEADGREPGDVCPNEEAKQVGAVRRGTDFEDPGPVSRLPADLWGDQERTVRLYYQPHRIVLLDVCGLDPLFRQGYDVRRAPGDLNLSDLHELTRFCAGRVYAFFVIYISLNFIGGQYTSIIASNGTHSHGKHGPGEGWAAGVIAR